MTEQIIGSNALYSHYTLTYFLEAQKALGIKTIAFHQFPDHLWLDHERCIGLSNLQNALMQADIRVASFHPGRYQYTLYAPKETLQGMSTISYYQRCIDTAAQLDCPSLVVRPTGGLLDGCYERDIEALTENLQHICDTAAQQKVRICLQTITPDEGPWMHTLEELQSLLKQVPPLQVALDTVSVSCANEDISQWFSVLGERIGHVVFQDGRGEFPRIWGTGVYPSASYAAQILQSGYKGPISTIGRTDRYQDNPTSADSKNLQRVKQLLGREIG